MLFFKRPDSLLYAKNTNIQFTEKLSDFKVTDICLIMCALALLFQDIFVFMLLGILNCALTSRVKMYGIERKLAVN